MLTTDWEFDFSLLPHWDNRKKIPYVYDEYYEVVSSDILCCIYSIAEVKMDDYLGFLAILKGKENPTVLLNVSKDFCFCNRFDSSKDGRFVFLQPSIYNDSLYRPILIIDILNNVFSFVETDNINPSYKIVELDKHTFKIEANEGQELDWRLSRLCKKTIQTDCLQWIHLGKISSLPTMLKH